MEQPAPWHGGHRGLLQGVCSGACGSETRATLPVLRRHTYHVGKYDSIIASPRTASAGCGAGPSADAGHTYGRRFSQRVAGQNRAAVHRACFRVAAAGARGGGHVCGVARRSSRSQHAASDGNALLRRRTRRPERRYRVIETARRPTHDSAADRVRQSTREPPPQRMPGRDVYPRQSPGGTGDGRRFFPCCDSRWSSIPRATPTSST